MPVGKKRKILGIYQGNGGPGAVGEQRWILRVQEDGDGNEMHHDEV